MSQSPARRPAPASSWCRPSTARRPPGCPRPARRTSRAAAARLRSDAAGLLEQAGAGCTLLDLSPAGGRIDREDALPADAVQQLVAAGVAAADAEVDAGADLLLPVALGAGATTVAATLVSVLTGREPVKVVGRGAGIAVDDASWMRKALVVRDARRRGMPVRLDAARLLAAVGGPDTAALAGFLLRAAARRTPVLLDGSAVAAAALVAQSVQPRAIRWWHAAHRSPEPAHQVALDRLGLAPLLELELRVEDGTGPLLAVPLVRAAAALAARADVIVAGISLAVTTLTVLPVPGRRDTGPPGRRAAAVAMSLAPVVGAVRRRPRAGRRLRAVARRRSSPAGRSGRRRRPRAAHPRAAP